MYITLLAISIGVTLIVSFSSYLVYLGEKVKRKGNCWLRGKEISKDLFNLLMLSTEPFLKTWPFSVAIWLSPRISIQNP